MSTMTMLADSVDTAARKYAWLESPAISDFARDAVFGKTEERT